MTVDMSDFDKAIERYEGALQNSKKIAKKMLENNEPLQKIISYTGLPEYAIRNLK